MLMTRIVTAVVLLAVFVGAFLLLTAGQFVFALLAVVVLAGNEWARLCLPGRRGADLAYAALLAGLLAILELVAGIDRAIVVGGAVGWCLAPLLLVRWAGRRSVPPVSLLIGVLVLAPAYFALADLRFRDDSAGYFLWALLVLVWAADIGAYFAGRAFGRRKLAPRVSPGKTWEGFVGGLACAAAAGAAVTWLVSPPFAVHPGAWLAVCLLTAAFAAVGDLTESLFKRMAGVKDSGTLLPGHGGVLDRIDGVLGAAPLFAIAVRILEVGAAAS